MFMVEKDAIRAVDEAAAQFRVMDGALTNAVTELKRALKHAHGLGYSQAALARRVGLHRNTVVKWLREDTP